MRKLMTGDEAIARGAYEAGVSYASAYPGTPSTERKFWKIFLHMKIYMQSGLQMKRLQWSLQSERL